MKDDFFDFIVINVASLCMITSHLTFTDVVTAIGTAAVAFYNISKGIAILRKQKREKNESGTD